MRGSRNWRNSRLRLYFYQLVMIREPAVAGRFYPAKPDDLLKAIQSYVQPDDPRTQVIGIVAPHAGYMYSGHVAGAVYSRIQVPSRNVILCPNHTGLGTPLSIMRSGAWQTPLGDMQHDQELCESLMAADSHLEDDAEAHRYEHALEVHLPFIQHVAGASATFAPITVGTANWQRLEELGRAIGEVLRLIDLTEDPSDSAAQLFKPLPVCGADGDRGKRRGRSRHVLHERQLHFERMFVPMRLDVIHEIRIRGHRVLAQFLINLHVTQRRLPCAGWHDGKRSPKAGVIRAKDYIAGRHLDTRINGAGDVPGIHIPGMRRDNSDDLCALLCRLNIDLELF